VRKFKLTGSTLKTTAPDHEVNIEKGYKHLTFEARLASKSTSYRIHSVDAYSVEALTNNHGKNIDFINQHAKPEYLVEEYIHLSASLPCYKLIRLSSDVGNNLTGTKISNKIKCQHPKD